MAQAQPLTDPKIEKTTRLPLILGLAGLALILLMTALLAFYPFHYHALDASVSVKQDYILITNDTDYDLKDVRLLLNTDYKLKISELKSHASISPKLIDFKKDDDTKFSSTATPTDLYITAVTPQKQTVSNIFKLNR
jgi:hypothetical protein